MTKLSIKQVRDVAHLARLTLREQDIMKYQRKMLLPKQLLMIRNLV